MTVLISGSTVLVLYNPNKTVWHSISLVILYLLADLSWRSSLHMNGFLIKFLYEKANLKK